MPTCCPAGHDSATDRFCAVCGIRMPAPAARLHLPGRRTPPAPGGADERPCPECGTGRDGRYCEECGFDFTELDTTVASSLGAPAPAHHLVRVPAQVSGGALGTVPPPGRLRGGRPRRPGGGDPEGRAGPAGVWRAVIGADPAYYQALADRGVLDPAAIRFPAHPGLRRLPLNKKRIHVGRRSAARGIVPDIDLGVPPEDPAVSHLHAMLLAVPDGGWVLLDLGSTNGTTVNGTGDPIAHDAAVPLHDGDRIYVGAWTVITLQKG
ncbi:FHA domain-containing protein [Nocardiopsis sediminis]|uniref:FHA domain-containing protein n=1 Tax=Nocardiopsis sediminis TaxID=1778267 RepID=A0ABV8FSE0_9ACTN